MNKHALRIQRIFLKFDKDTLGFYPNKLNSDFKYNPDDCSKHIIDWKNCLLVISRSKMNMDNEQMTDLSCIVENDLRLVIRAEIKGEIDTVSGETFVDCDLHIFSLRKGCLLLKPGNVFYDELEQKLKTCKKFFELSTLSFN